MQELQKQVSVISRVIIHPKYRSIGLGEKLVRDTLPLVGTPFVEAVAVMANYNPFFEGVGMQKIAESKPDRYVADALQAFESLGFGCMLMGSPSYNLQKIVEIGNQPVINILTELSRLNGGIRRRLASTENPYHAATR